jgi:hypothetical protein
MYPNLPQLEVFMSGIRSIVPLTKLVRQLRIAGYEKDAQQLLRIANDDDLEQMPQFPTLRAQQPQ